MCAIPITPEDLGPISSTESTASPSLPDDSTLPVTTSGKRWDVRFVHRNHRLRKLRTERGGYSLLETCPRAGSRHSCREEFASTTGELFIRACPQETADLLYRSPTRGIPVLRLRRADRPPAPRSRKTKPTPLKLIKGGRPTGHRRRSHALTCEECGEPFTAYQADARFCTGKCQKRASRRAARAAVLSAKLEHENPVSGNPGPGTGGVHNPSTFSATTLADKPTPTIDSPPLDASEAPSTPPTGRESARQATGPSSTRTRNL
jgi:hypothetical protein